MAEAALERRAAPAAPAEAEAPVPAARRRHRLGLAFWLPVAWIAFVVACAAGADWLPLPAFDYMDFANQGAPPGTTAEVPIRDAAGQEVETSYVYVLGTDLMGRDIVSRLMHGARVSLVIGLVSPAIGLVIGGAIGMLAGYYRGWLESIVVAVVDTILAFPAIVLLLAVVFVLGGSLLNLTLTIGFLTIPFFARVARANTLTYGEREFVLAARAMGASDGAILVREILPNVILPMLVYALLAVAALIVLEGALSYLGLSVPSGASWGGMIAEGKETLDETPRVSFIPAFVMFLTVLSFNLMGDVLRGLADAREASL